MKGENLAPQVVETARLCASDDPTCTGLRPCDSCCAIMQTQVLPLAVMHSHLPMTQQQILDLMAGYALAHHMVVNTLLEAADEAVARAANQSTDVDSSLQPLPDHGTPQSGSDGSRGDGDPEAYRLMLATMSEEELEELRVQFLAGELPDQDKLTDAELSVFREVLKDKGAGQDVATAPTEPPLARKPADDTTTIQASAEDETPAVDNQ